MACARPETYSFSPCLSEMDFYGIQGLNMVMIQRKLASFGLFPD